MHFWCWHFSSSWSYSPILNHQKFDLFIVLRLEMRIVPNLPCAIQTHESLNNVTFEGQIQPIALSWWLSLIPHSKNTHCCQGKPAKYLWHSALQGLHRVCSITPSHTQPSLSACGKHNLQMVLVGTAGEERWGFLWCSIWGWGYPYKTALVQDSANQKPVWRT